MLQVWGLLVSGLPALFAVGWQMDPGCYMTAGHQTENTSWSAP